MFKVFAVPGGYAVAYVRPDGKATIQTETHNREAALLEAHTRNEAAQAEAARQQLRDIARTVTERRSVRWFEPDAFA